MNRLIPAGIVVLALGMVSGAMGDAKDAASVGRPRLVAPKTRGAAAVQPVGRLAKNDKRQKRSAKTPENAKGEPQGVGATPGSPESVRDFKKKPVSTKKPGTGPSQKEISRMRLTRTQVVKVTGRTTATVSQRGRPPFQVTCECADRGACRLRVGAFRLSCAGDFKVEAIVEKKAAKPGKGRVKGDDGTGEEPKRAAKGRPKKGALKKPGTGGRRAKAAEPSGGKGIPK
jgi:hypothetical protein